MKIKTRFTTFLMLALVTAGRAQTLDKAKLDQLFDRLLEKNKGMGSLTLAKDGNVVYSRSFGYRQINEGEKIPSTAETKYRIASITKMFTAVMIFQLAEEKRLRLAETLDKFFPQIPNAPRITIGQILRHRSGIHDIEPDGSWGKQPRTHDEMVARIAQGQPDFEPDARHQYSNAGYILLGYIVEKVSGKPYQEALKERITSSIGLKDTYFGVGNTDPNKNEALSYRYVRSRDILHLLATSLESLDVHGRILGRRTTIASAQIPTNIGSSAFSNFSFTRVPRLTAAISRKTCSD